MPDASAHGRCLRHCHDVIFAMLVADALRARCYVRSYALIFATPVRLMPLFYGFDGVTMLLFCCLPVYAMPNHDAYVDAADAAVLILTPA